MAFTEKLHPRRPDGEFTSKGTKDTWLKKLDRLFDTGTTETEFQRNKREDREAGQRIAAREAVGAKRTARVRRAARGDQSSLDDTAHARMMQDLGEQARRAINDKEWAAMSRATTPESTHHKSEVRAAHAKASPSPSEAAAHHRGRGPAGALNDNPAVEAFPGRVANDEALRRSGRGR